MRQQADWLRQDTSPASIGLYDVPRHAGQVVRRVLLRRNIVIDAETAQLVGAAVQAGSRQVRPPGRRAGASARPADPLA